MNASQFHLIYQQYYPRVMRICMGYVHGNEAKAKDLTQEVLIKVWENIQNFRQDSKLSTWIYRITVNTCLMHLRRLKQNQKMDINPLVQSEYSTDEAVIKEMKFQKMYKCIDQLSPENKAVILLELEGRPQQEIAEVLGISHEAVRVRIHRIKNQLTTCVNNENI